MLLVLSPVVCFHGRVRDVVLLSRLLQASDMGTPELRRLLRLLLRQHSGGAAVAPAALGPAAEALASELHSAAEAAVSTAEAGGGQRPAELAAAAAAAASVDSFSPEVGDHGQLLVCNRLPCCGLLQLYAPRA
jgi:hypothetical protein